MWLPLLLACAEAPPTTLTVVTFNTGTSESLAHDAPPDDGYGAAQAARSDEWYGDGLAWWPAIEATRAAILDWDPDLIAFQEIFHSPACAGVPDEARAGFVCDAWSEGDPTVAELVTGEGWAVACHPGKPDKCLAVNPRLGALEGGALEGFTVEGCGQGARVARGEVALARGGSLTVVSVHGSSGLGEADEACRLAQVEQVFVDLGDGRPGADGAQNLVLGDLNTDPHRFLSFDESAARWADFVGEGRAFSWRSPVGPDAPGAYGGLADIDHVASDALGGGCEHAGIGLPAVMDAVYFDHLPVVCALSAPP